MLSKIPGPVILALIAALILGILWTRGTFSAKKQYRNRDAFSSEGVIQENLAALNAEQIENQASYKFHFDNRITDAVMDKDTGGRLDSLYTQTTYRGPYGISTRSAMKPDEPEQTVEVAVEDVAPNSIVEVQTSQVKPEQNFVVKKEDVIDIGEVIVKAKDIKPGEKVTVSPDQVKPNQMVLKQSSVTGESVIVPKEEVDVNERVIADSIQLIPDVDVLVKALQVEPNKPVVAQGKDLSLGKSVTTVAEKIKPGEVVVVKTSDTKPNVIQDNSYPGPSQVDVPVAADGIELEVPEPISLNTVETRLASDSNFGNVYSMNKYPAKKAYATVSARQNLSEIPVRSTVHTSRI